jgi:O-antigen ligase
LLPILVVNVLEERKDVLMAGAVALLLAMYKGIEGLVGWGLGLGRELGDVTITYYEPTANFVLIIASTTIIAAFLTRATLPWWANIALPLMAAALILSFRRSFWAAAAVAIVLVILLTSGVQGRRLVIPALGIVAAAVFLASGVRAGTVIYGPVAERFRSLEPESLTSNREDRYRIDEFRNVSREIELHPITGIGLGVPWTLRFAVGVGDRAAQGYTHVAALYFWLKLGLIGLFSYAAIMVAGLIGAFRVWKSHADPRIRAAGLACFGSIAGLVVAETTATWTGADYRFNVVLGVLLGWLAAAYGDAVAMSKESSSA